MKKQNQNSVLVFRCDNGITEWFDTEFDLDVKESFIIDADALENGYVFHRYKIESRGMCNPFDSWTYVYGKIEDEAEFKKQLFNRVVLDKTKIADLTDGGCYKVIVETCVLKYTSKKPMQPVRIKHTDSFSFEVVYDPDMYADDPEGKLSHETPEPTLRVYTDASESFYEASLLDWADGNYVGDYDCCRLSDLPRKLDEVIKH